MTDYTALIAELRSDDPDDWPTTEECADALEAQARRIAELEEARDKAISFVKKQTDDKITLYDEQYALRQRIAELEKMLAVHRLAVDVDALKARIAELEAAIDEAIEYVAGHDDEWPKALAVRLRAARAAYRGEKE